MSRATHNLSIALLFLVLAVWQGLGLPLSTVGWWPAFSLLPVLALTPGLWALVHEGLHGRLAPQRAANEVLGSLLGVAFGSSFTALRHAHLMHHRFNRSAVERVEVVPDDPGRRLAHRVGYYAQLCGGLYILECVGPLVALLPGGLLRRLIVGLLRPGSAQWRAVEPLLTRPQTLWRVRVEALLAAGWLALCAWLYGERWPLLAAFLASRALLVSLLDYPYHYATRSDAILEARNLSVPAPAGPLMLHFHLHGVHHRHPGLAWQELPEAFAREGGRHDGTLLRATLAQLRGPLTVAALESAVALEASRVASGRR